MMRIPCRASAHSPPPCRKSPARTPLWLRLRRRHSGGRSGKRSNPAFEKLAAPSATAGSFSMAAGAVRLYRRSAPPGWAWRAYADHFFRCVHSYSKQPFCAGFSLCRCWYAPSCDVSASCHHAKSPLRCSHDGPCKPASSRCRWLCAYYAFQRLCRLQYAQTDSTSSSSQMAKDTLGA